MHPPNKIGFQAAMRTPMEVEGKEVASVFRAVHHVDCTVSLHDYIPLRKIDATGLLRSMSRIQQKAATILDLMSPEGIRSARGELNLMIAVR